MKIAIDLDGVLRAEARHSEKYLQSPIKQTSDLCWELYFKGHEIVIYTANPWQDYDITKAWLDKYAIKYTTLVCGKYPYDILLDDRAYNIDDIERFKGKCQIK